jgi:hypothetical protein
MEPIIIGAITIACVGTLIYAVYEVARRHRINKSGLSANGIVTRTWTTTSTNHTASGGMQTTTNHHAEAAYTTHTGERRVVRFNGRFRQGDTVNVRYDEKGAYVPLRGRKSSAGSGCGGCLGFLVVVVVVIVIAAFFIPEIRDVVQDTLNDLVSMNSIADSSGR